MVEWLKDFLGTIDSFQFTVEETASDALAPPEAPQATLTEIARADTTDAFQFTVENSTPEAHAPKEASQAALNDFAPSERTPTTELASYPQPEPVADLAADGTGIIYQNGTSEFILV